MATFEPLQLLNFDFNSNPDPAFNSNADPDPNSKNNADPEPSLPETAAITCGKASEQNS
jgi:hypothetical protein